MEPKQDTYPFFEANQVLTNAHLNQQFNYLDEQERLTRANLIGIGIVCGLDIKLDNETTPTTIFLSRGCGITSEGYLIVEPDDLVLVSYRQYALPDDVSYPSLMYDDNGTSTQYPLLELFPAGEPNTTPLENLADKAVLLFLELKKAGLRNCSPNNCDDKGANVTTTLRRLLISKNDLKTLVAKANSLSTELTFTDLEAHFSAQLNLPDLRLPRYDVPDSHPATSNDVLAAFLKMFNTGNLVASTGDALTQAYRAFQPLLKATYADNPFSGFTAQFGFLAGTPTNTDQVRFLPYYYDFFDDLLRAYDEFRGQGLALLCACCPSGSLFPRHVLLGLLFPDSETGAAIYRQRFLASAAMSNCEQRSRELVQLFQRMVEMVNRFTHTPSLPPLTKAFVDPQIRMTPSQLGDVPLSDKAIPYYYQQSGTPPLYQLWNAEKNRRNKANQNLSYRADEYVPAAPAFITQPLAYDLEPYNFLRIEGHLGKNYQAVLNTLLSLKASYRLPIDVIALRTGAFDDNAPVDLSKESCRFQDLETLYDVTREQILCFLVKELTYFYNLPTESGSPVTTAVKSQFAVINRYAPDFLVLVNSLGRTFEDYITRQGGIVPEIDANLLASLINNFSPGNTLIYYSFFYLIKLADTLPSEFASVKLTDVETRFKNLQLVVNALEKKREQGTGNLERTADILTWEEIDDRLEDLLNACQLDALKAIQDDYVRRLKEIKKKQFLSHFLTEHPGIQHKAGVPFGGTFILVYHQDPVPATPAKTASASDIKPSINPLTAAMILPGHVNTETFTPLLFIPKAVSSSVFEAAVQQTAVPLPLAEKTGAEKVPVNPAMVNPVNSDAGGLLKAETRTHASDNQGQNPATSVASKLAAGQDDMLKMNIDKGALVTQKFSATSSAVSPFNSDTTSLFAAQTGLTKSFAQDSVLSPSQASPLLNNRAEFSTVNPAAAQVNTKLFNAGTASNKAFTDALKRLQTQQPSFNNPDLQLVLDGLSVMIPVSPVGPLKILSDVEKIIAATVTGFTGGTVIGDFYLPYQRCSDCAPVQFVLPKAPPVFTVTIGCTRSDQEIPVAAVTITAQEGMPPYRIKIDGQSYQTLVNPVLLTAGEHTLIIQDANETVSAPKTITISAPLRTGVPSFTCNEDGQAYVATLDITGGTPPYTVNDLPIEGASFTTAPIANEAAFLIKVTDQNQCAIETTISHACPPPCDLPLDGQSQRCAYRLWVQPALFDEIYETYKQTSDVRLRFNGQALDLVESGELLQINADDLNKNFQAALADVVKRLNAVINNKISETFGALSVDRLAISYEPSETDPFGILWIEHFSKDTFSKDTFSIEFDFGFQRSNNSGNFSVRYGNEASDADGEFDGVIFINRDLENKQTRVPAFDCSQRNQCTGSAFVKLCEGFDIKPNFLRTNQPRSNIFVFTISEDMPTTGIAAWVWDFSSETKEPFYVGEKIAIVWRPGGIIRLTAITEKGCFSVHDKQLL